MCIIYILTLIYFGCLFVPIHFQLMFIKHQIDVKFHLSLTALYNAQLASCG